MTRFKLICPVEDDDVFATDPANAGFGREHVLDLLAERSEGSYEVLNGSELSAESREDLYFTEAIPAAGNRYRISSVFGSAARGGGPYFGTGVPALIVYDGNRPTGVYPNRTGDGRYHTIADFLKSL